MVNLAIDHVQIAIPVGGEEAARGFYGGLLGLTEIPKPENMASRGGCWFQLATQQLHVGTEADFRPAKKAHVALATKDLDAVRARLQAHGYTISSMPRSMAAVVFSAKTHLVIVSNFLRSDRGKR